MIALGLHYCTQQLSIFSYLFLPLKKGGEKVATWGGNGSHQNRTPYSHMKISMVICSVEGPNSGATKVLKERERYVLETLLSSKGKPFQGQLWGESEVVDGMMSQNGWRDRSRSPGAVGNFRVAWSVWEFRLFPKWNPLPVDREVDYSVVVWGFS